jgi:transcriptional regulator GlxA family with amidase domain
VASLQLKLLGGLAAHLPSGRVVAVCGRKNQALLAYLAINAGKQLARAKLINLLRSEIARFLVMFLKRPGGQSQFSGQLAMQLLEGGRLNSLLHWITDHLAEDLTVEAIAAQAHVSARNLQRMFLHEVGTTPAKFVEALRVEEARRRLEDCDLPCERIATDCGFRTGERMRRSFKRKLHTLPESCRKSFGRMASGMLDGQVTGDGERA